MNRLFPLVSGREPEPYKARDGGFYVRNGGQSYNRALYGKAVGDSRFSVFAGDRPEWLMYHAGGAGYLFLCVARDGTLRNAARYPEYSLWYGAGMAINEAVENDWGALRIETLPADDSAAALLHVRWQGLPKDARLCAVYGGIDRAGDNRNLDAGYTAQAFTLFSAERAQGNAVRIEGKQTAVCMDGLCGTLSGTGVERATVIDADAFTRDRFVEAQSDLPMCALLFTGSEGETYLRVGIEPGVGGVSAWTRALERRNALRERATCVSGDAALDAALPCATVALEGSWLRPYYLHGAWSWRIPLLGWRSRFGPSLLGWGDRVTEEAHAYYGMMYDDGGALRGEAVSQFDSAYFGETRNSIPERAISKNAHGMGDERYRLARQDSRSVFNSDGAIPYGPGKQGIVQYDMQEDFFTQAIYQLRVKWDDCFARETLSRLRRHLAWQARCFGPDGDGLYENFANFWASDSIQYAGAGCALATANNYFACKGAEGLCAKLGMDPSEFALKAQIIRQAFQERLWLDDARHPAECVDALGECLTHPLASLPTIVTCITSGILSPEQCCQSLDYASRALEHVPTEDGELVYTTPMGAIYVERTRHRFRGRVPSCAVLLPLRTFGGRLAFNARHDRRKLHEKRVAGRDHVRA